MQKFLIARNPVKRRRTGTKRKGLLFLASLLCLLVTLPMLFGVGAMGGTARAENPPINDVDISTGVVTNYFMDIGLSSNVLIMDNKTFMVKKWGEFKAWERQDKPATLLLRFNDVKYKEGDDKPELGILVTKVCNTNFPGSRTLNKEIQLKEIITVNVRETYYRYLLDKQTKGADLSNISFSLFWDGTATRLLKKNDLKITVNFHLGPQTSTDPNDPNFDLGSNGGSTFIPVVSDLFAKFWAWFCSIWGSTKPLDIFWQVVVCFIGLVVVVLFFKFMRWLFGGKK